MLQETNNLQAVGDDDHYDTTVETVSHDTPENKASFGGRVLEGLGAGLEGGVVAGAFLAGAVGTVYGIAHIGKGAVKAGKGIGNWWNRRKAKAVQAQTAKAKTQPQPASEPTPQPQAEANEPATPSLVEAEQTS